MINAQKPKQRLEAMFHAIDTADWADFAQFFRSEVVYERPGHPDIFGIDALLYFYRDTRVIAEGEHVLTAALADDDHAICFGYFKGRSKSGEELAERFADAYELRNGLICKWTTYFFRAAI